MMVSMILIFTPGMIFNGSLLRAFLWCPPCVDFKPLFVFRVLHHDNAD